MKDQTILTDENGTPMTLMQIAGDIADKLNHYFPYQEAQVRQIIALAEEVGEFTGAARRYLGMARRNGSMEEMSAELADVIITAWVTAYVLGIDLETAVGNKLQVIYERGWIEPR